MPKKRARGETKAAGTTFKQEKKQGHNGAKEDVEGAGDHFIWATMTGASQDLQQKRGAPRGLRCPREGDAKEKRGIVGKGRTGSAPGEGNRETTTTEKLGSRRLSQLPLTKKWKKRKHTPKKVTKKHGALKKERSANSDLSQHNVT